MGEALYRKYRSKNLDEVVGQEHVTTTLKNALKSGKISHAYLLTGPRGTGKTSIARILAHEVNNLQYSDQAHLDIIEIDAASNRRIDEVRDIRDKVRIAPSSAKYKVYIIDEVHMLTKEAFNALLKTLEEPPKHAIFILATTEVHKLPETIISRTQRFNLKPITSSDIAKHLAKLAKAEKITVSDEALGLIAKHSNGGLRDAISLFDQLASHQDTIEASDVQTLLGIAPQDSINELMSVLDIASPKQLIETLTQFETHGFQAPQIAHQLSEAIRSQLVEQTAAEPQAKIVLLGELVNVPHANNPHKALELALLGYVLSTNPQPIAQASKPNVAAPTPPTPEKKIEVPKEEKEPEPIREEESPAEPKPTIVIGSEMSPEAWSAILQAVKKTHNTLYGVVRMAKPLLSEPDATLTLSFGFAFHQKRMNEAKNKQLIQDIVKRVSGQDLTVVCVMGEANIQPTEPKPVQAKSDSGKLDTITDIFGGGEVLEN